MIESVDRRVGMGVVVNRGCHGIRADGGWSGGASVYLEAGLRAEVTRMYSGRVQIRFVRRGEAVSVTVSWNEVDLDPNGVTVPSLGSRRRLGQKPEDTEDMQYIGIDHPGIQWLFDDMGAYATEKRYCSEYDALTARLGIPGRPREFNVSQVVDGLTLSATVLARSMAEASEILAQKIASVSQPVQTESAE